MYRDINCCEVFIMGTVLTNYYSVVFTLKLEKNISNKYSFIIII